jgi:SAM-dependent methyltransferase
MGDGADRDGDGGDDDGFAAATYGRGFADVYDRWYPADDATTAAVEHISRLAGPSGRVLELGVGTGRLAVPLAERGHQVVGMDASSEMLEQLAANAAHLPDGAVRALLCDLAEPSSWPAERPSVVVAAFNLVCNLTDPAAQARLFISATAVLAPGGHLVVETFLPAMVERRERHLQVREVRADAVVLIASDTDPDAGIVTGQHIELRDGEPVRLRPWRLRLTTPAELDRWAAEAGLERVAVWQDWTGVDSTGDDGDPTRIAVYRAPLNPA